MYDVKRDTVDRKITQDIHIGKYSQRQFDYIAKKRDYAVLDPRRPDSNQATYYLDMKRQVKKQDFFRQWLKTDREVHDQNLGCKEDNSKKYFNQIKRFYDLYIDQGRRIETNGDQFLRNFQSKNYENNKNICDLFDIWTDKPQVLQTQHQYILHKDRQFDSLEREKTRVQDRLQYRLKDNQTTMRQEHYDRKPSTQLMRNYLTKYTTNSSTSHINY